MDEKQYLISQSLLNTIANYLANKPWFEVNEIITDLKKVPEVVGKEVEE